MTTNDNRIPPAEEAGQRHQDEGDTTGGHIEETPEGFPVCQWCGGAITEKEDLVVAADETGVPTRIAPVGYTAPRSFATYHRDCHLEATGESPSEETADATGFWTPANLFVIGVAVVVVLVVLYFALFPQ